MLLDKGGAEVRRRAEEERVRRGRGVLGPPRVVHQEEQSKPPGWAIPVPLDGGSDDPLYLSRLPSNTPSADLHPDDPSRDIPRGYPSEAASRPQEPQATRIRRSQAMVQVRTVETHNGDECDCITNTHLLLTGDSVVLTHTCHDGRVDRLEVHIEGFLLPESGGGTGG